MEFSTTRSELLPALQLAQRVASPKDKGMPLLACVLMRASKDGLLIGATDLVVSVSANVTAKVERAGGVAIDAKTIASTIAGAPDEQIKVKVSDKAWIEIRSGKARYRLPAIADRDFPKLPASAERGVVMSAPVLASMIDRTGYACSVDTAHEVLRGVYLRMHGDLGSMTSGDGHRFARARFVGTCAKLSPTGVIVPRRALPEIARLISDAESCEISESDRTLFVTVGGVTLSARLIDGTYPNLDGIITSILGGVKVTTVADRTRLVETLKRVSPITTDTRGAVLDIVDGGIEVSATSAERGEISDEFEAEASGVIKIGVNAKYIVDALGSFDSDRIKLQFGSALEPIIVTQPDDDSTVCVVMPMRVD